MQVAHYIIATLLLLCHHNGNAEDSNSSASNEISGSNESDELTQGRRIIGGETAKPGQFPYVVRLYMAFGNSYAQCTGTIISSRAILTAAHCVYSDQKVSYVWAQRVVAQNRVVNYFFSSDEIYYHPQYDGNTISNDVAVLKLKSRKREMTGFGQAPQLPNADIVKDIFTNTGATVAGFGKTSDSGSVSSTLQYAQVNMITNEVCQQFFGNYVRPTVLCTLNRNKGICSGDSGGPLMITRNSRVYINGINSFGYIYCEEYAPSAYTFVFPYVSWIKSILDN